jgi:hypothetical protein
VCFVAWESGVGILPLSQMSCVSLVSFINHSEHQFPYLQYHLTQDSPLSGGNEQSVLSIAFNAGYSMNSISFSISRDYGYADGFRGSSNLHKFFFPPWGSLICTDTTEQKKLLSRPLLGN